MAHISIELDKDEIKILEKRAKKNLMTLKEQIEDIIRRSCVSSSKKTTLYLGRDKKRESGFLF